MSTSLERQRQALSSSHSLREDLNSLQASNKMKFSKTNPKEHQRQTKKQATQQKKLEKSYQRQRARAEEKAMRMKAQKDVGLSGHHHNTSSNKRHSHTESANAHGHHSVTDQNSALGHYVGGLPPTRKVDGHIGSGKHGGGKHDGGKHGNNSNGHKSTERHLNKGKDQHGPVIDLEKHSTAPLAGHIDASSHWVAYVDDSTKYTVYYNEETNVSSWNPPPGGKGFRWVDVEGGEEPPKGAQETVSGMEDPEGLGADWMNTEYQAPSVDRAADYRRRVLFQAGECSLWCDVNELSSMGIGTLLYFKLIRHLIWTFCLMFLVTTPIIFSFSGSYQDVIKSATTNYFLTTRAFTAQTDCLLVGSEDTAAAYGALCQSAMNKTVVSVYGTIVLTSGQFSFMVAFLDAVYTILFMVSMTRFFSLAKKYTAQQDFDNCTIQDYAIMVEGLPKDPSLVSKQDVVNFFSTKFSPTEVLRRRKMINVRTGVFDKNMDRSVLSKTKDGATGSQKGRMTMLSDAFSSGSGRDSTMTTMTTDTSNTNDSNSDSSSSSDDSGSGSEDEEAQSIKSSRLGGIISERKKGTKWSSSNSLGLFPVANVACSVNSSTTDEEAKQLYVGTWVTQVALAHPDGNGIRHYRNKQECLLMLRRQRARTLMNAAKDRSNERVAREKAKLEHIQSNTGDVVTEEKPFREYIRVKDMEKVRKLESNLVGHQGSSLDLIGSEDRKSVGKRKILGAFVVFKHEESYAAALTEYSFSAMGGAIGPCLLGCQSRHLRYEKSWPLKVTRAPDPTDILWENFDTSWKERKIRRLLMALLTFVLLVVSFSISTAVYVYIYEAQASLMTPISGGCDYVKSAYVGSWMNQSRHVAEQKWSASLLAKSNSKNNNNNNNDDNTINSISNNIIPPLSYTSTVRGIELKDIRFVRRRGEEKECGSVYDEDKNSHTIYSLEMSWSDTLTDAMVKFIVQSHINNTNAFWNMSSGYQDVLKDVLGTAIPTTRTPVTSDSTLTPYCIDSTNISLTSSCIARKKDLQTIDEYSKKGECSTKNWDYFDPATYATNFQWGIQLQGALGPRQEDLERLKHQKNVTLKANEDSSVSGSNKKTSNVDVPGVDQKNTELASIFGSTKWSKESLHSCYCFNLINDQTKALGLYSGIRSILKTDIDVCGGQLAEFLAAKYLFIVAVLIASGLNILIQEGTKSIVTFERHTSKTAAAAQQQVKTFFGMIINTGFIIVVVNSPFVYSSLFQEEGKGYKGFNALWYTQVGASIVISMFLDTVVPHGPPAVINCLIQPCLRSLVKRKCCCGLATRKLAPTQGDLNTLYDGGEFELPLRLATVLNTMAMTLIFCGGMPILIPICALAMTVSYWVDKYFILRLYHRPPNFDNTLIDNVKYLMPLFVVIHLLFSFWMYSDDSVFYSASLDPSYYTLGVDVGVSSLEQELQIQKFLAETGGNFLNLGKRVTRLNTLPILILVVIVIVLVVVWLLLTTVVGNLILVPLKAVCMRFFCCCLVQYCKCCQAVRREFNPPLTEHFLKVLRTGKSGDAIVDPKKAAKQLSDLQRSRGWRVRHDREGTNNYYKCRVWEKGGISHGKHHEKGDLYHTYETMDETGIPSYAIADNPEYKVAMSAQMTAENATKGLKKGLAKAILGVKLKGGIMAGIFEKKEAKIKMTNKYAVAGSYKESFGGGNIKEREGKADSDKKEIV